jgi:hypothetical protein
MCTSHHHSQAKWKVNNFTFIWPSVSAPDPVLFSHPLSSGPPFPYPASANFLVLTPLVPSQPLFLQNSSPLENNPLEDLTFSHLPPHSYWLLGVPGLVLSLSTYSYHILEVSDCFSILKMEATCSSETFITMYHTTQRHISEVSNLCS